MTDFELSIDGVEALQSRLQSLKERLDGDAAYTVGTNVKYGIILERGRGPIEAPEGSAIPIQTESGTIFRKKVSGHPPYPWFKPAIREFKANPETFIISNTGYNTIDEIPTANALVEAVANALSEQMASNASAQSGGDRSPGTDGDHPSRDSGNLAASISATRIK